MTKTDIVILAAGKGTRMRSHLPKVLHKLAGKPLLSHVLDAADAIADTNKIVVTGHGAETVRGSYSDGSFSMVEQTEQLGTAHAVQCALGQLRKQAKVVILYGDVPLITPLTIAKMLAAVDEKHIALLTIKLPDPSGYGRIIRDPDDQIEAIVEQKDATAEQLQVNEVNTGVMALTTELLASWIPKIGNNNAQGEYYLTDLPYLARTKGLNVAVVTCDAAETLGINSRAELAAADAHFQTVTRNNMMESGVTLIAPDTVYFSLDTVIGRDAFIEPNVVFGPHVTVDSGATIRAFSHLEGCHISKGSIVGPFARLRKGTQLSEDVRIGNFVEVKNATLSTGAKVNHLSYIGDASIGEKANIGAGTITCNYDGVMKHHTKIGSHAFIGSSTMLVAPISIGDEAMTGSGSVITSDVEAGALALARARQTTKSGMARKLFQKLRSIKAKQTKGE